MVGVPGEAVSNTLPPDVLLLAIGAALVSAGIAFLALGGIAAEGGVGVRGVVVAGTILGAWLLWRDWRALALSLGDARSPQVSQLRRNVDSRARRS